jgi:ADP-ribose pyrophosphatase
MLRRAESMGLRVTTLPEWYDVDTEEDLKRLASELAAHVALGGAATRAAMRALREQGHAIPAAITPWRVQERRVIHRTPWRTLIEDRLITHGGETIDYTFLQTEQAVWVVPVTHDGRVVLIRQYRHPAGEFIIEVPAGGGSGNPEEIARRELVEETGARATTLAYVASFFPASAHLTHRGHVYVAFDSVFGEAEPESTELLAVFTVPFELALDMARRGEIGDSQSALAILAAEPVIRDALRARAGEPGKE